MIITRSIRPDLQPGTHTHTYMHTPNDASWMLGYNVVLLYFHIGVSGGLSVLLQPSALLPHIIQVGRVVWLSLVRLHRRRDIAEV